MIGDGGAMREARWVRVHVAGNGLVLAATGPKGMAVVVEFRIAFSSSSAHRDSASSCPHSRNV